ncbi:hypothetical protein P7F88_15920 [Vibrio hannami]|uniref:hypothetical protein n=1 Tax=Vibrio hannami TaxID=2717094 RepID=UPI00240FB341|nr:hypothetical protein [Vibrio hannami]MDG3087470.1 hypothetical protein [Vibrio hannami]
MKFFRYLLVLSTVIIYVFTIIAVNGYGFNWPSVAVNDLLSMNWRSQFDIDFLIHLFLLASWVVWREGATVKAYVFGFLSIVMGGMFSFPYIAYLSIQANASWCAY